MQSTDNQAKKQESSPNLLEHSSKHSKQADSYLTQDSPSLPVNEPLSPHTVQIDPRTDLNMVWQEVKQRLNTTNEKIETDLSQDWDMGQWDKASFSDEVYQDLPNCLRDACRELTSSSEREVFVVGALGVISGLMPNVVGHYDGKSVGSNLYAYILAPYGTGKGGLEYARLLGAPVHKAKRADSQVKLIEHQQKQPQYERDKKAYLKDKSVGASPPIPPKVPPQLMLFIPANNSKSGLYQNLMENNERGIIIETEGDTLADAVKQDYAGFTDLLRNAFHHERCTFFRRGNGGEYVEVSRPYISLVLSSTFDQLRALIPSPENGLFSRFMFYEMKSSAQFRNVFDKRKRHYTDIFTKLGESFKKMYDYLNVLESPLYFDLSDQQETTFVKQFQTWKDELREYVTTDLDGTVNRLGLICFRVMMVFTVIRGFDMSHTNGPFVCSAVDFANALQIVETLKVHAVRVYNKLPKGRPAADVEPDDPQNKEHIRKCRELFAQGMTNSRAIAKAVFGDESKKSSVYRWTH